MDVSLDTIDDGVLELTVGDYLEMAGWFAGLPDSIQELFAKFSPGTMWGLRAGAIPHTHEGDWFMPNAFRPDGTIDMAWFSPSGLLIGHVLGVKPADLHPLRGH